MKSIKASAPATVANVSCGFDIFGFAVEAPADEVVVTLTEKPGVRITKITGDDGRLPLESDKNTAGVGVGAFLKHVNIRQEYCRRWRRSLSKACKQFIRCRDCP
jgi:homoserine kinase